MNVKCHTMAQKRGGGKRRILDFRATGAGEEEDGINYQFPLAEPSREADHVFIERIGRQMTEPGRDPTFAAHCPQVRAGGGRRRSEGRGRNRRAAGGSGERPTNAPLDLCGATAMAGMVWLECTPELASAMTGMVSVVPERSGPACCARAFHGWRHLHRRQITVSYGVPFCGLYPPIVPVE